MPILGFQLTNDVSFLGQFFLVLSQMIFGTLGPPSSAFPKKGTNLLTMSRVMPRMAQMVYRVTENERVPEFTLNTEF